MAERILSRLSKAMRTIPGQKDWLWAIALLLMYGLVYLPIGFITGFLSWHPESSFWTVLGVMIRAFLMPGLNEELMFRVLPIPHPTESVQPATRWFWSCASWLTFLLYHPFNIIFGAPAFFSSSVFLLGAGLLGVICTLAYLRSGSLWIAVFMHWLIVVIWLLLLGGLERFQTKLP